MQLKVIIAALAICAAPAAFAQPEPTYFLVDVSGSMKDGLKGEAEELLRREVSSLVSITYFGGKPEDAERPRTCGESTSVSPVAPPGAILPPLPELGGGDGSTDIGTALRETLAAAPEDATVVLITDGKEECLADFKAIRAEYPNATIKVLLVGKKPNTALQLLELKPDQVVTSNLAVPQASPPSATNYFAGALPFACGWVGGYLWLPGLFLGGLLVMVVGIIGSYAAAFGRNAEKHEEQQKERKRLLEEQRKAGTGGTIEPAASGAGAIANDTDRQKSPIGTETWIGFWVLLIATVALILPFFFDNCVRNNWLSDLLTFADGSFGSKFLPVIFGSFVGWVLLQFWGFAQARQTSRNNAYIEHRRAEDQRRKDAEDALRLAEAREEFKRKWHALDESERSLQFIYFPEQGADFVRFSELSNKIKTIRSSIADSIVSLEEFRALRRFTSPSSANYRALFHLMREYEFVSSENEKTLREIFEAWRDYLRGKRFFLSEMESQIEAFDPTAIRKRQKAAHSAGGSKIARYEKTSRFGRTK